jgi:hypothetical protein
VRVPGRAWRSRRGCGHGRRPRRRGPARGLRAPWECA